MALLPLVAQIRFDKIYNHEPTIYSRRYNENDLERLRNYDQTQEREWDRNNNKP